MLRTRMTTLVGLGGTFFFSKKPFLVLSENLKNLIG